MTSRMQFCSFASREYLPFARVLANSLRRHQPDAELFVLLVDDLAGEVVDADEPFHCVRNDEICLDPGELHRLYLIHGRMFLAAIKPFFIDYVIRMNNKPTLFLDTDVGIYGSLADLGELIDEHGILLVPHTRSPYPLDGLQPDDTTILSAGTFNDGVIGFGERGLGLLEFLKGRLGRECVVQPERMRVCGQRWIDYAPSFFSCHVLRDPGVNAAYWNLHERPLSAFEGQIFAGDAPLRAYHFSGYDPANPRVLSKHAAAAPRIDLSNQPILSRLCEDFVAALNEAGLQRHRGIPQPFDTLPGNIPADDVLRVIYRDALLDAEARGMQLPPDAYNLHERQSFLAWVAATYPTRGVEPPYWAVSAQPISDEALVTPSVRASAPAVSAPDDRAKPTPSVDELVRLLARSSSAALGNLDRRLSDLERTVAELRPVAVPARG